MRKIFTFVMSLSGLSIYSNPVFFETYFTSVSYTSYPKFNSSSILNRAPRVTDYEFSSKAQRLQSDIHSVYQSIIINSRIKATCDLTLHSYDVTSKAGHIQLYWVTKNEIKHNYFELERSFDNKRFKTVALFLGARSVREGKGIYDYWDKSGEIAGKNILYYRLKQVDMDGMITYSGIEIVRLGSAKN